MAMKKATVTFYYDGRSPLGSVRGVKLPALTHPRRSCLSLGLLQLQPSVLLHVDPLESLLLSEGDDWPSSVLRELITLPLQSSCATSKHGTSISYSSQCTWEAS